MGAQIIPNPINEALQRVAETYIRAVELRKQRELERERIDVSKAHKDLALLATALPFIPKDTLLEDAPTLHPILQRLGVDPTQLAGSMINPTTVQDAIGEFYKAELKNLDPQLKEILGPSSIISLLSNREMTPAELFASEDRAKIVRQGLQDSRTILSQDPEAAYDYASTILGLEQPVRFTFGGKDFVFSRAAGGSLALQMAAMQLQDKALSVSGSREEFNKLLDDTLVALKDAGIQAAPLFVASVLRKSLSGGLTAEEIASLSPEQAAAASFITGNATMGQGLALLQLQNVEPGVAQMIHLGRTLSEIWSKEDVSPLLEGIREFTRRAYGFELTDGLFNIGPFKIQRGKQDEELPKPEARQDATRGPLSDARRREIEKLVNDILNDPRLSEETKDSLLKAIKR